MAIGTIVYRIFLQTSSGICSPYNNLVVLDGDDLVDLGLGVTLSALTVDKVKLDR